MEILLNKFKSKKSNNVSLNLATNLIGSKKLLPQDRFFETINEMIVYNQERENCNIIRLNCVINPICSNVLFNSITEIIKNEGSPNSVQLLNYGEIDGFISRDDFANKIYCKNDETFLYNGYKEAIRDTQLSSHKCGFKYHCGIDIFNNHILRNNTFKTVCYSEMKKPEFNTLFDWMRDENGLGVGGFSYGREIETLHLYTNEDIDTYDNTIENKLFEKNGWFGFTNTGKFGVVDNNNETMDIFRIINYRRSCDFIQMYPSSDLWSFTPKYNSYLHRLEKNWNYCLTYPSSSTTKNITFINEAINSLKIMYIDDRVEMANGLKAFKIYSISKHGLKKGEYINLYHNDTLLLKHCEVRDVENDYVFYIFSSGLKLSTRWYELTRADTDTSGVDDFEINIDVPLDKFYLEYNNTILSANCATFSANTETVKKEDIIRKTANNEWKTINYHGKTYTLKFKSRTKNLDPLASGETEVTTDDIIFDLKIKSQEGDNYVYEISNVAVNMKMQYIISTDREKVYCGHGDDRKTYYLINNKQVNIDDNAQNFSYKKVVDGEEVQYYVRIFSRLPNWKGCEVKIDEHQLYGTNKNLIAKYQTLDKDFENHISQLAFAKNVYGDDISQIVYTDDIDISYLKDNLGRPLTSIYLTILKNNKGYKEWYGKNGAKIQIRKRPQDNYENYHIEYSHCFGMLNCAFRLSKESLPSVEHNNSIQINNIDSSFQYQGLDVEDLQHSYAVYEKILEKEIVENSGNANDDDVETINRSFRSRFKEILNDEIQYGEYIDSDDENGHYKGDTHFYGDLCAYSNQRLIEQPIQQIEMRFNTAQRELSSLDSSFQYFKKLYYDEIKSDDLDKNGFIKEENEILLANQHKEGYCYHPHYEIPIKTFASNISYQTSITMTVSKIEIIADEEERQLKYAIKTLNKHNLQTNDTIYMKYDVFNINNEIINTNYYICYVTDIINDKIFECEVYDENHNRINTLETINILSYRLFKKDNTTPNYATFAKDGSCRFIWRNVINNGFDTDSEIENYPFFNGALYVSKKIDLFVRRQDPKEYANFITNMDIVPNVINFIDEDNYSEESDIVC